MKPIFSGVFKRTLNYTLNITFFTEQLLFTAGSGANRGAAKKSVQ